MISIVSAGTPDYAEMMAENRRRCEALGYRYIAHDLELSSDLQGALPPCTFKPELLRKVLSPPAHQPFEYDPTSEIIAWMDADAIVVRPLEPLLEIEFDVAVTLREPYLIGTTQPTSNYLNAGVIFFRNTPQARRFIEDWLIETDVTRNDQAALNHMVGSAEWTDQNWRESYDWTFCHEGAFIHILQCAFWNFNDWNRSPSPDTRILHFKHGWRELRGDQWWRNLLAGRYACLT
jgi:hypothetical protein